MDIGFPDIGRNAIERLSARAQKNLLGAVIDVDYRGLTYPSRGVKVPSVAKKV